LTNARIFEGISYTFIPKGNCEKGERGGKGIQAEVRKNMNLKKMEEKNLLSNAIYMYIYKSFPWSYKNPTVLLIYPNYFTEGNTSQNDYYLFV
jgi:hypothetical protein